MRHFDFGYICSACFKKAVAASTSIAALTKNARFKAIVLSIRFSFKAFYARIIPFYFSCLYQCRM
jgi:hypothetical protein